MKFSATLLATAYAASGTDYSLQGENWEDICATGLRQSPIDIHPGHSVKEFNFNPFYPVNYDRQNTWDVTLEGGIKMTPNADDITFTGGYLESEYKLAQFHLHWGDDFRGGSEHTVDGRRYFSEVHFVHYNSDRHTGLTPEALADGEGLAVLGYFIDAGDFPESELDRIIQRAYAQYDYENDAGNIEFNANDMVGGNYENFYRYEGSLTTPTCNEAVQWTVFNKPLTINMATRALITKTAETGAVNNNYRVPMPLNGRQVTFYHDDMSVSSAESTTASIFFATCAALALN